MIPQRYGAYFISGVDTDSGKTYVTGRMAAYLRHRGVNVITQKPVQTHGVTISEDLVEHRKTMGCGILPEDREGRTCTYLLHNNGTPMIAASLEGIEIDVERIDRDTQYLVSKYSIVLVEGSGGIMTPLSKDWLTVDYVASRHLPLVLVVASRPKDTSEALMSIELCKTHGAELCTIVFNLLPETEQEVVDSMFSVIQDYAKKFFPDVQMIKFRSSDSFWDLVF